MTLHIFNPEHDIALASGLANFTAPHAGRQLRHDLGYLPALWAEEGDGVLVVSTDVAARAYHKLSQRIKALHGKVATPADGLFTAAPLCADGSRPAAIDPWGWNAALAAQLRRMGVVPALFPSTAQMQAIRELSHRRTAMQLLSQLRSDGTVGEAFECRTAAQVDELVAQYGHVVLKAPWSSSGRGLRFVDVSMTAEARQGLDGWLANVLSRQGSVMVEPYYNKVKDFGMEFVVRADGTVSYEGLSLFHTKNGAYTGNILATETAKREMLGRYLSLELLDNTQEAICRLLPQIIKGQYTGPLGVDMMVAPSCLPQLGEVAAHEDSATGTSPSWGRQEGAALHPCVEINLRRTMGHVALALTPLVNPAGDDGIVRVMRIDFTDHYELKIEQL